MTKQTINKHSSFIKGLYDSSYKELFAFLLRRSSNKQQAQDLSQEAYLRLIRVERTDLIEQPKAYLFRIAANLVYETRIKSDRSAEKKTYPFEEVEDIPSTDEPHMDYETAKAIIDLDKIIKELPLMYQTVLLMRKRDGLKHMEIANKLGISIHTVRKYLTRAVAECRKAHSMGDHHEQY
ncbi:RNA polymerase sigma factor [Paraglaciecola psychrophila]|uniref:ECF subfamily RNA polymerase sigma-24 factor n=1 Tax=Paraglaciecola psychrophila 170 TaxID=1129794 RepID=K7ABP6_9ALTE|nr:sigma-70 family RNA polymerase sigma factor [Paraglaciecola psychrophila]AGH43607.1 hypothetical protein C427_1498 [Paraglaciecola psychrophila 170]GAC39712.1 RNA polymerase sigma-70 factor, ECF subfamily [Paraglaciecola psychrophila 170]